MILCINSLLNYTSLFTTRDMTVLQEALTKQLDLHKALQHLLTTYHCHNFHNLHFHNLLICKIITTTTVIPHCLPAKLEHLYQTLISSYGLEIFPKRKIQKI